MQENITGFYETNYAIYYTHSKDWFIVGANLLNSPTDGFIRNRFYAFINMN